jgi:hypothetical protein
MNRALVPEDIDRHGQRPVPLALRSLVRACVLLARQTRDRNARNPWPDDKTIDLILRASVPPHSIADQPALAAVKHAFVAALVSVSAAAQVISHSLQLNFDNAATITVPGLSLPNCAWVAEGDAVPVAQGLSTPGALLNPFKLGTIITLTNEIVNYSNAEPLIRQLLIESVGPTLDAAMFSNAAGTPGLSPPGLLNGIAPLTASSSTGLDALVADIAAITEALAPSAGGSPPILVAAPAQAVALTMLAYGEMWPAFMSAALPAGTVVGIIPAGLATVVEAPRLETSADTVLHMASPATEIVNGSGVLAAPVRSVFQTDSVALKLIVPASWSLRSPTTLAWMQGVSW